MSTPEARAAAHPDMVRTAIADMVREAVTETVTTGKRARPDNNNALI
jgi:hypothetical protein